MIFFLLYVLIYMYDAKKIILFKKLKNLLWYGKGFTIFVGASSVQLLIWDHELIIPLTS